MIQDISPDRLNNTFCSTVPDQNDYILLFDDDGRLFAKIPDGRICFTTGKDFSAKEAVYLFSVNQKNNIDCCIASDRNGKSLFIKKDKIYVHLISQERFVEYCKQQKWVKEQMLERANSTQNLYVVLVEDDEDKTSSNPEITVTLIFAPVGVTVSLNSTSVPVFIV